LRWATFANRAVESTGAGTADPEVPERGRQATGPALQGLIAFTSYLAAFVALFGRAIVPHLNVPSVGQDKVDPNFYIWAWGWWPHALTHGLNPLHSYLIGAPAGYNLAWATTAPAVAILSWPVTAAAGPIAAFNVTLLLAPPASAWAAFVAARKLTGKFWPALLAGPVYGFCSYELSHDVSGQPNLTVTLLPPLMVYLVLLWWDGTLKRAGYVVWMAVALALEFYTFVEAFAEITIVWAAALLIGLAVAGAAVRPKIARLALHTAAAYAGAIAAASPYLFYAVRNYPRVFVRQQPQFSLDLASLVIPDKHRLLGMNWLAATSGHVRETTSYIGIPMLALFVLLAVFTRSSRLVRMMTALFAVIIALTLGPRLIIDTRQEFPLPWTGIWSLPLLRSAEPVRFIDLGYLILALCLAVWLSTVTVSAAARVARWALAVAALVTVFADLPTFASVVVPPDPPQQWQQASPQLKITNDIPAFFAAGTYKRYLKPGENVVILSRRGNAGMLFQAYTGFYFRIAGGFINDSLSRDDALPPDVGALSQPTGQRIQDFKNYVREAGVGSLIVEDAWAEKWMYIFTTLGLKGTDTGGVTVFQLTPAR
jgi:hypothetical protein